MRRTGIAALLLVSIGPGRGGAQVPATIFKAAGADMIKEWNDLGTHKDGVRLVTGATLCLEALDWYTRPGADQQANAGRALAALTLGVSGQEAQDYRLAATNDPDSKKLPDLLASAASPVANAAVKALLLKSIPQEMTKLLQSNRDGLSHVPDEYANNPGRALYDILMTQALFLTKYESAATAAHQATAKAGAVKACTQMELYRLLYSLTSKDHSVFFKPIVDYFQPKAPGS